MKYAFVLAALVLAGCSSGGNDMGATFNDEGQAEITCMQHQAARPGERYLKEENWDTDVTLPLLRYYTSNGKKPYCDGQGASEIDKVWFDIYRKLGGDAGNISI
ncbi:hypothetical protein Lesp02_06080 [Lentzea sp. NBRC 105346]|uniref:hypothetical protein n=1 Tax=Lentzea sp. NBRC 105346 TaxID=3032205 RepID=UPI0024A19E4A|nr:hypothetical protein [Lentzea sp. NBRC 105346]GLZ28418.1 hypothetical protein Lesp02_06080 [Lentzea sp. NBRC 105346]